MVILSLIGVSLISLKSKSFKTKMPLAVFFSAGYLCFSNLLHLGEIKISSFVFSLIILLEILLLFNLIKWLKPADIKFITKSIILLYFLNIGISSLFISFNYYPKNFLSSVFKIYFFDGRIRPYGFSDEPSYAAILLVFNLFVLLKCNNFSYSFGELTWYFIAVLTIILTGSSYGYLLLFILLLYFMIRSGIFFKQIRIAIGNNIFTKTQLYFILSVFILALIFAFNFLNLKNDKSFLRIASIVQSFVLSDEFDDMGIKKIAMVDGSASMRVLPTVDLINSYNDDELVNILFGHGAGTSVRFFSNLYEGNTTLLGFIPAFIYNYGIIGVLLFLYMLISFFPKRRITFLMLFTLFILNADFNTQIFVFVIYTAMVSKKIEVYQQFKTVQLVHE